MRLLNLMIVAGGLAVLAAVLPKPRNDFADVDAFTDWLDDLDDAEGFGHICNGPFCRNHR